MRVPHWPGQSDLYHRCLSAALTVTGEAVASLILPLCDDKICCAYRRIPTSEASIHGVWEPLTVLLGKNSFRTNSCLCVIDFPSLEDTGHEVEPEGNWIYFELP